MMRMGIRYAPKENRPSITPEIADPRIPILSTRKKQSSMNNASATRTIGIARCSPSYFEVDVFLSFPDIYVNLLKTL